MTGDAFNDALETYLKNYNSSVPKAKRKTKDIVAEELEISRAALYNLIKSTRVDQEIINRAIKLGIVFTPEALEKKVPYYDLDAIAGNSMFKEEKPEYIKEYIVIPPFSDCDMYINISGNSMYPKYCSGDRVALKRINDMTVVAFGEAYVVVTDEQRFLKYLHRGSQPGHWTLRSENEKDFGDFEVPINKVTSLFIVKGKIQKNII